MSRFASRFAVRLLTGLCLLALAACAAGPQVRTNQSPGLDFNQFRTFAFFEPLGTDNAGYSSLVSEQLRLSMRIELESRGFIYDASGDPDLRINFQARLNDRIRVRQQTATVHSTWGGHRRGFYGAWPMYTAPDIDQFTEGTLIIDVVDARRAQLVWEGVATDRVTQAALRDINRALDQTVTEIMARFPILPRSAL